MSAFEDGEALADARNRLRRVQGQVGGILAMIQDGRDCRDVILQIAAASRALERVGCRLLVSQLQHCLAGGAEGTGRRYDADELERLFLTLA